MSDEPKVDGEEKVEETPTVETPVVEAPKAEVTPESTDASANVDAEVDKLAKAFATKLAEYGAKTVNKATVPSVKKVPQISATEGEVKIYRTKMGKQITMTKSKAEIVGKYLQAIMWNDRRGMQDMESKLQPLVEGVAGNGGNLVPTLLHNVLVPIIDDRSVMNGIARTIDMTGMKTNQLNVDAIASKPIVSWTAENVDKSTSSMTFGQQGLTPYTLATIVPFSKQLRDDSPFNIVEILTQALGEAIAVAEDKAFFAGSGSGQPTGLNSYTFRGKNIGDIDPTYDIINDAYFTLPQAYRSNGTWVANGQLIARLANIKDTNGYPIFREQVTDAGFGITLKGRPIMEQNDLEATSLFFGDFSYYWIARKGGVEIEMADQASLSLGGANVSLWQRNLLALRAETRVDGECVLTRAFVEMSNINIGA